MMNLWLDTPKCIQHEVAYHKSGRLVGMVFTMLVIFSALLHYNEQSAAKHGGVGLLRLFSMHANLRLSSWLLTLNLFPFMNFLRYFQCHFLSAPELLAASLGSFPIIYPRCCSSSSVYSTLSIELSQLLQSSQLRSSALTFLIRLCWLVDPQKC